MAIKTRHHTAFRLSKLWRWVLALTTAALMVQPALAQLATTNLYEPPAACVDGVLVNGTGAVGALPSWVSLLGTTTVPGGELCAFSIQANTHSTIRSGTVAIGAQNLTITQGGAGYIDVSPLQAGQSSFAYSFLISLSYAEAVDPSGNVFYDENKVTGPIQEVEMDALAYSYLNIPFINKPAGLATDLAGNLYICDDKKGQLEEWIAATSKLSTNYVGGSTGLFGIAVDAAGNIYFTDQTTNTLRRVTGPNTATTLASGFGKVGGLAVDVLGNVYVADITRNTISRWAPSTQTLTTLLTNSQSLTGFIAVDTGGNIYYTTTTNAMRWSPYDGGASNLLSAAAGGEGVAVDSARDVFVNGFELVRAVIEPTNYFTGVGSGSITLPQVLPPSLLQQRLPFAPTTFDSSLTISPVTNGVITVSYSQSTVTGDQTGLIYIGDATITGNGASSFFSITQQGAVNCPACASITATSLSAGWLVAATPTNVLAATGLISGPTNFTVVQWPQAGRLIELPGFATNGKWTYLPNSTNVFTADSFAYVASDKYGNVSPVATMSISVTNLPFAISRSVGWLSAAMPTNALTGLVASGKMNFAIIQYPANGALTLLPGFSTNGLWTFHSFATPSAPDSFLFTVSDTNGNASQPGTIAIAITNLPVAVPATVGWLKGASPTNTLQGIVASGVTNFVVSVAPTNGTLMPLAGFATNGRWQYTTTNYGADRFMFYVTDSQGHSSAPATVNIGVTNLPWANSQTVVWTENFYPSNQLTGLVASGPPLFTTVQAPASGIIIYLPGFATNGLWQYFPNASDYYGSDSLTFTVTDTNGNTSAPGTIAITITQAGYTALTNALFVLIATNAPYAHTQYLKTRPGQPLPIKLIGDDDANDPAYLGNQRNGAATVAHTRDMRDWNPVFTVLTQPTNGTLTGTVPNLVYVSSRSNMLDSFTYKVNNGVTDSPPATVWIRVALYNSELDFFATNTVGRQPYDVTNINPGTVRPWLNNPVMVISNNVVDTGTLGADGRCDDCYVSEDGSTGSMDRLGRLKDFYVFGLDYTSFCIDNNGLISWTQGVLTWISQSFPINPTLGPLFAPYWGDVDTRGTSGITNGYLGSGVVEYQSGYVTDNLGNVGGRPAQIITWPDVGVYNTNDNGLSRFQMVLIDRSDLGPGDMDCEFNYEYAEWLQGSAGGSVPPQAGFDAGDGVHYFNAAGSQTSQMLLTPTLSNLNPPVPGRQVFRLYDTPPPEVAPLALASAPNSAQISGSVNPNGPWSVSWLSVSVLSNGTPVFLTNVFLANLPSGQTTFIPETATVLGLLSGTAYAATLFITNEFGMGSNSLNFTTPPQLVSVAIGGNALLPVFNPGIYGYVCYVPIGAPIACTAVADNTNTAVSCSFNGSAVPYAAHSFSVTPNVGDNPLTIIPANSGVQQIYHVDVIGVPQPVFSGLGSPSIAYGTTQIALGGALTGAGPTYPAQGDVITATIGSHTVPGSVINTTGGFSVNFADASLATAPVSGSPYPIAYAYAGNLSAGLLAATTNGPGLVVAPAALLIGGPALSKAYGATLAFPANVTNFPFSGAQNGETVGSIMVFDPHQGGVSNAPIGNNYPLVPSAATGGTFNPGNYSITYSNGQLTVGPLPVALAGARPYDGTAVVTNSILFVTNRLGADDVAVASGSGTLMATNIGTNVIVSFGTLALGGAAAANYTLAGASGAVVVTPASLVIGAVTQTITYGTPVPPTTVTYNGFGVGETNTVLHAQPSVVSALSGLVPAGVYSNNYTVSGAAGTNYTISYVPGALTVNPFPLTVGATGVNKDYDGTAAATVVLYDNRLFGDSFTDTYINAVFAGIYPGANIAVLVSRISISGPAATNYIVTDSNAVTVAGINFIPPGILGQLSNARFTLQIQGIPGQNSYIQQSSSVAGPWQDLPGMPVMADASGLINYQVTTPPDLSFYRVGVHP